jgi:hypothetical protein
MIEEIPLPTDTQLPRPPAFQLRDLMPKSAGVIPLGDEMEVVRHQRAKPELQTAVILRLFQTRPDALADQRVCQGSGARTFTANRHEPEVALIYPRW